MEEFLSETVKNIVAPTAAVSVERCERVKRCAALLLAGRHDDVSEPRKHHGAASDRTPEAAPLAVGAFPAPARAHRLQAREVELALRSRGMGYGTLNGPVRRQRALSGQPGARREPVHVIEPFGENSGPAHEPAVLVGAARPARERSKAREGIEDGEHAVRDVGNEGFSRVVHELCVQQRRLVPGRSRRMPPPTPPAGGLVQTARAVEDARRGAIR